MTTYRPRPTFRVTPAGRGGGGGGTRVISERAKIFSHHQLAPPQLSPTMRLITKSRNIDESGSALISLNQLTHLNDSDDEIHPPQTPIIKDHLKRENFQEFAARMMKTSSDQTLTLGPEIHAALLSMANGINPMLGQERKRQLQRRLQARLGSTATDHEPKFVQGQTHADDEESPAKVDERAGAKVHFDEEPPQFVSTFGTGVGRASLDDMESFQKRNRLWKSTLKSTLKIFQRSPNNPSDPESEQVTEPGNSSAAARGRSAKKYTPGVKAQGASKATKDLDRVLQRGSILLMASSALKPKAKSRSKEQPPVSAKDKPPIEYIPSSFVGKAKAGALRLPIYDRIDSKRKNVLTQGFPFENFEREIAGAVRNAAQEMKKSFGGTVEDETRTPFNGVKISALVGNNAATVQGFRPKKTYGPADNMNPFQLKMVQGLEAGELSSFLENHERRTTLGFGMQIIPGRAPDTGASSAKGHYRPVSTKPRPIPSEAAPLEPKFRALPKTVMSRVGEDFGAMKKQEAGGMKGFPDFGSKWNSVGEERSSRKKTDLGDFGKPGGKKAGIDSLKKLSFMDITKSEFLREMRNHQNEFQRMKSKDEMRKSFPKTYVFPRKDAHHHLHNFKK